MVATASDACRRPHARSSQLWLLAFLVEQTLSSWDPKCDCAEGESIDSVLSGSRGCLMRAVLSTQQAAAAAQAVRTQLHAYPTREVQGGSGADIASFDGGGGEKKRQSDVLKDIIGDETGAYVAFDSSSAAIGAVNAAMDAVSWPAYLVKQQSQYVPAGQLHDSEDGRSSEHGWPILSAGAFPSGVPPHVHGSSHLLLLQGKKAWAMWPPDQGLPESARTRLPSPLLRTNASAVFKSLRMLRHNARPMFCKQRPGDLMLLPAGTHHATLNMEPRSAKRPVPVIGVGGQVSWDLDDRLQMADRLLESSGASMIAAHAIAGTALARRLYSQQDAIESDRGVFEVAAWHLQKVVAAEPMDARAALALARVLDARGGAKQQALAAIMQAVTSLLDTAEADDTDSQAGAADGVEATQSEKHPERVSIAAGLRRCVHPTSFVSRLRVTSKSSL